MFIVNLRCCVVLYIIYPIHSNLSIAYTNFLCKLSVTNNVPNPDKNPDPDDPTEAPVRTRVITQVEIGSGAKKKPIGLNPMGRTR
jgi:hypothetical protein